MEGKQDEDIKPEDKKEQQEEEKIEGVHSKIYWTDEVKIKIEGVFYSNKFSRKINTLMNSRS